MIGGAMRACIHAGRWRLAMPHHVTGPRRALPRHAARPLAGSLLLVLTTLATVPAPADTPPSDRLANEFTGFKGLPVTKLEVIGLGDDDLTDALRGGLELTGDEGLILHDEATFYPAALDRDLERARLFLARHGYPLAAVTPELRPEDGGTAVRVRLHVDPGVRLRVAHLAVVGLPAGVEAPSEPHLAVGSTFTDAAAEAARRDVVEHLRQHGHARARATVELDRVDRTRVDVRIVAAPGPRYRFGEVEVRGVSADLAEVARQQTVIEPGDVYSPRTLERAEINLRFLRLFRRIQVDTAEREGTADVLDVIMQLSPRHYPALELGVGYWTDDGLRGQASWEHRNLLGRGRGLRAALRAGQFEQRGRLSTWLATLWKSRAQATTALELLREDEESYELLEGSLELTLTYPFSFRTVGRVGVSLSYAELSVATGVPAALDRPPGTLTEVFARWDQDGTDDRIQPSDGYWVRWSATVAPPGLGSPTSYLRGETEGTLFRPLGPTVVAVRLLVGAGSALEDGQALFANRRFFAGGASSMRGFERRQLGPQDADGDPIGGEAKLETSLDLRFPLVWRLHGALFVDAAQVWLEARDVRPFDLEVAYGPGLLLDTPIGPIRGDLGLRAGTFDGGFPEYQLHLSIGQPF